MTKRRLFHFGIVIGILALGFFGMRMLTVSKSPIAKHKPPVIVPVARVIKISTGPRQVSILGQGTVRPLREIQLVPQVGGKVIYISSSLVSGGAFDKGETLLRVDSVDYELSVTLAKSQVKDSESRLKLAEEEAAAAKAEWRIHNKAGSKALRKPPPLVAKEPQLAAAQSKLEADRAGLEKALLALERTELKAPFECRIDQKNVDIGQYVSPGQTLATLYSTEVAEIILPLEDKDLLWFHVPGFTPGEGPGSLARVRARIAGRKLSWGGTVVRAEGKLDECTRMINVVVRVVGPYAKKPPLAVGSFVSVDIEGLTLPNAAIIPRPALHQEDIVWVVNKDSRLQFRKVEVARSAGRGVMIKAGLEEGDMVVISPIKAVTEDMVVRISMVDEVN